MFGSKVHKRRNRELKINLGIASVCMAINVNDMKEVAQTAIVLKSFDSFIFY